MEKIWKAKWIMDEEFKGYAPIELLHKQNSGHTPQEHEAKLKNRHMLVRKKFSLDKEVTNAYIDITADDYYKLYVNGHYIGQGPAPAYHFHYNYNRYDLSEYLKTGDNVIAVHVYYQGLVNRVWNSGDYRQGMICELFVDGELAVCSDSSWKYNIAREFVGERTTGYDTQYLEDIDARLKDYHWCEVEYDDSTWKDSFENHEDDHKLFLQTTPPLQVYKIKPETVHKLENGHYLIDFGKEITGQFYMETQGEEGQTINIMCGEELIDDGPHVRYKMRCNCDYHETWILSGGHDVLEYYDYKAFRYVEVQAPKSVVKEKSFAAIVRHYPFDEKNCLLNTSDELLNSIWTICKNGVKCGSQEAFLDCPSREKGQYLGDATITSLSHFYLTGDLRLYKKALKDFALSTVICPGMMAVAPGSFMQEIADFSLQWPLQLLNYYRHSGDRTFLEEMYPVAEGIVAYFKKYERKDGLIENVKEKWNLVDWPQNYRDGYDFDLSTIVGNGCHNVINAFYCGAVKAVNDIKNILGLGPCEDFERLKNAYVNAFFNKTSRLFVDSTMSTHSALHSNSIPLFFGLVPEYAVDSVVGFIREKRLACGVYNAYFLLKGLAAVGEHELVYELLTSRDKQSWGNMVIEGATTCFEAWGKDQKWNTSLCHPWASAPIPVLIEDIIGLKPAKPGWEEIEFHPVIPKGLKFIDFEMSTPKGRIKVCIKDGNAEIQVPQGIKVFQKGSMV